VHERTSRYWIIQLRNSDVSNYELSEPGTVAETIDGEAVVINLERGIYFSIRGVGLAIWTDLLAGSSPEDVVVSLCTRYSTIAARIPADVSAFLDQLTNEGLIRPSKRPPCPPAAVAQAASYDVPSLEKYTDMEALLLLDPIHDTDEQGWPKRS
jgi:coenzyme PQQ synthesis protein D (PqqD)